MSSSLFEIAPNIFRIAHVAPASRLTFIQFLIVDEKPLLYHTGSRAYFPETLQAVKRILDPAKLRYISWSHLESDECGALNDFLVVAPNAELLQGEIGVRTGVGDFFQKPVTAMPDGTVLELGTKRLHFLATPDVPHAWDAITVFEETTGTLFCSDLFATRGAHDPLTEHDIVGPALASFSGPPGSRPIGPHTTTAFERLEALQPRLLAPHHASAYAGNGAQALHELRQGMFRAVGLEN